MSAKQDRQGVRHARDIEQKYDLSAESKALNVASEARRTAERANMSAEEANKNITELTEKVEEFDENLNQTELIDRLTSGTGVISSADGTLKIDLINNKITVNTLIINGKTVSWKDNEDGTYTLIGS